MLFFQLEWNISTWSDILSTESLVYNLIDQMETKNRVKKCLKLKVAFGKAKANQHFESEEDLDVYTDGSGLFFLQ